MILIFQSLFRLKVGVPFGLGFKVLVLKTQSKGLLLRLEVHSLGTGLEVSNFDNM